MSMRTNKEILAEVNQMVSDGQISQDVAEKYFPELRESKDERMMKIIMNALIKVPYSELDGLIPDTIHIWLEGKIKQGEQEPIVIPKFKVGDIIRWKKAGSIEYTIKEICDKGYINTADGIMDISQTDIEFELVEQKPTKVIPKFKVGDVIRLKGTVAEYTIKKVTDTTYYTNGWSCSIERCEEDYELVKQKPTEWSEEDEELCEYLIKSIEESDPLPTSISSDCKRWLKTLKGRVLPQSKQDWKPSEEQMIALKCAITTADEKWVCMNTKDLESLYEDLKKLTE